tara:strand:- start:1373 stop:1630 length:258 start_codon:yes stop_codon:yes gene_type:complete
MMIQGKCPDCKKMWITDTCSGGHLDSLTPKIWPQYEEGRILEEYCSECCVDNHDANYLGEKAKLIPKKKKQGSRHIDPKKVLMGH